MQIACSEWVFDWASAGKSKQASRIKATARMATSRRVMRVSDMMTSIDKREVVNSFIELSVTTGLGSRQRFFEEICAASDGRRPLLHGNFYHGVKGRIR